MSKNIKIGDETFKDVEYISCACADEAGAQRLFRDVDSITDNKVSALVDGTITEIAPEDLAGITKIREGAFQSCTKLTSIVIPDNITKIGDRAFYDCQSMHCDIIIPDSVTEVGYNAFYRSGITSFKMNDTMTTLAEYALAYCYSLTDVTFGAALKYVGRYLCAMCTKLSSIILPASVTTIFDYAFSSCTKLETVTVLATTPPTLSSKSFNGCTALTKIIVPAGTADVYKAATNWSAYANIIVEAEE